MERIWNYLFYLQWKFLNGFAKKIIQQPIIHILNLVPFFRENLKKGKKNLERFTNDPKLGINSSFAFSHMFLTTSILYAILFINVIFFSKFDIPPKMLYYLFIAVFGLSYVTNYLLLKRGDIYLKYFKEFGDRPFPSWHYIYLFIFHIGSLVLGILSVQWTVGWHF